MTLGGLILPLSLSLLTREMEKAVVTPPKVKQGLSETKTRKGQATLAEANAASLPPALGMDGAVFT